MAGEFGVGSKVEFMNIRATFLDEKVSIDANWLSGGVRFDFRAVSVSKASFNWVHSIHTGSMNAFHSSSLVTSSCHKTSTNGKSPPHFHINLQHTTIPLFALTKG